MLQAKLLSQRCGAGGYLRLKKHDNLQNALLGSGMKLSSRCCGTGTLLPQPLDTKMCVRAEGEGRFHKVKNLRIFFTLSFFLVFSN
jgi:hypothetical protein